MGEGVEGLKERELRMDMNVSWEREKKGIKR
jgi:hypothetical protein